MDLMLNEKLSDFNHITFQKRQNYDDCKQFEEFGRVKKIEEVKQRFLLVLYLELFSMRCCKCECIALCVQSHSTVQDTQ